MNGEQRPYGWESLRLSAVNVRISMEEPSKREVLS